MASKRRLRRNACIGKQRHPDLPAAMRHIKSLWHKDGHHPGVQPYHCRYCGGYHVGHRNERRSQ